MPRPPFQDGSMIGQKAVLRYIDSAFEGAATFGTVPPPMLLIGPAGCGKSTAVMRTAEKRGSNVYRITAGPDVTPTVLVTTLRQLRFGDTLILDEAHGLASTTQEILFGYLDRREIPGLTAEGRLDRTRQESAAPAAVVLATTWPGHLLEPLLNRLDVIRFEDYRPEELKAIARARAESLGASITAQAAKLLADRCQRSPRIVQRMVDLVVMFNPTAGEITQTHAEKWLSDKGISKQGLSREQQQYVMTLGSAPERRSTLERLVGLLGGVDAAYVRREIEPFLVILKAVEITGSSRQRQLSVVGVEIFDELRAGQSQEDTE